MFVAGVFSFSGRSLSGGLFEPFGAAYLKKIEEISL